MSRKVENNATYEKMLEQAEPRLVRWGNNTEETLRRKLSRDPTKYVVIRRGRGEEEEERRTLCIKHRNAFSVSSRSVSS